MRRPLGQSMSFRASVSAAFAMNASIFLNTNKTRNQARLSSRARGEIPPIIRLSFRPKRGGLLPDERSGEISTAPFQIHYYLILAQNCRICAKEEVDMLPKCNISTFQYLSTTDRRGLRKAAPAEFRSVEHVMCMSLIIFAPRPLLTVAGGTARTARAARAAPSAARRFALYAAVHGRARHAGYCQRTDYNHGYIYGSHGASSIWPPCAPLARAVLSCCGFWRL